MLATMENDTITVPYKYQPRRYQLPILQALDSGIKRICWVAHRRSGKDKTCINIVAKKMLERVGTYYYLFPEYNQGRKVLWKGIGKDGMPYMDHFPKELIARKNETEMSLEYKNGSIFQVVGGDRINALMSSNPVGVVLSEYSLMDPNAWRFLRPILAENGGWAIFVYTARGENHGYQLYTLAKKEYAAAIKEGRKPGWYCRMDTAGAGTLHDTGAISQELLDQERREIIHLDGNDALYQQEYECNFTVPIAGAYYAAHIMKAYQEGRVGRVPHDPRYVVDTWWDLGVNDKMAIWFTQTIGVELRVIDYYDNTGEGLPHYIEKLQSKGYVYGVHGAPHDIKQRELTNGRQRIDTAKTLGIQFKVAPSISLMDGIDSVRALFPKCWFDSEKCNAGLNALKNYRKKYDETRKTFLNEPYHDWSSNGADAFRTCAITIDFKNSGYRRAQRDPWAPEPERRTLSPDAV